MNRNVKLKTIQIKKALVKIGDKGFVLERKEMDFKIYFSINQNKDKEIRTLFEHGSGCFLLPKIPLSKFDELCSNFFKVGHNTFNFGDFFFEIEGAEPYTKIGTTSTIAKQDSPFAYYDLMLPTNFRSYC